MPNGYTPTQQAMLKILEDGELHTPEELHTCLWDEEGPLTNIGAHLTAIRWKLRLQDKAVAFIRVNGKSFYQLLEGVPA